MSQNDREVAIGAAGLAVGAAVGVVAGLGLGFSLSSCCFSESEPAEADGRQASKRQRVAPQHADGLSVLTADYSDQVHGEAIRTMLNKYAMDEMGGGQPIDSGILGTLLPELAKRPFAFSVLAFVDGQPAGLLNCFEGFSTFAARPLVNVHDCIVRSEYRRRGISTKMLEHCEAEARERGCCKVNRWILYCKADEFHTKIWWAVQVTLEVLEDNEPAKNVYAKFGMAKEYAWWQKNL